MSFDIMEAFQSPTICDQMTMRAKVLRLEEALKQFPQLEEDVSHHFAPGIYARELRIPAGAILTGKIHRFGHMNFLVKGEISVLTEHGVRRLIAPDMIVSSPGIKRAGYAHSDCIWITVHPNVDDEQDLKKLEARYIAPTFDEIECDVSADQVRLLKAG